jgi:tRNA pseudouridine55 synthase
MTARLRREEALIHRRSDAAAPAAQDWNRLVLLVDKPRGITSFDVIRRLRRVSPIRKIGHAGTLDPMATGLLICICGRATRLMESFMGEDKTYTGVIRLGQETPSYDAETDVVEEHDASGITDEMIRRASGSLVGEIVQMTPAYSAVKVGGERLYRKARRGENAPRPPRQVSVRRLDFDPVGAGPDSSRDVRFTVVCSSGTYVRAIAHDLGQALGVGGHLVELRRQRSGEIDVSDAWPLDELLERLSGGAGVGTAVPGGSRGEAGDADDPAVTGRAAH